MPQRTQQQLRTRLAVGLAERFGITPFDLDARIPHGKRPSDFLTQNRVNQRRQQARAAHEAGVIRPGEKLPNGRPAPDDESWTVGYWIRRGGMLMFQRQTDHLGNAITEANVEALMQGHLDDLAEDEVERLLDEEYLEFATEGL